MVRSLDFREFVAVSNQWRSVDQLELAMGYVGVGEHSILFRFYLYQCTFHLLTLIAANS